MFNTKNGSHDTFNSDYDSPSSKDLEVAYWFPILGETLRNRVDSINRDDQPDADADGRPAAGETESQFTSILTPFMMPNRESATQLALSHRQARIPEIDVRQR